MKHQLEQLKALSAALEPGPKRRRQWTQEVIAHAEGFLNALPKLPAFRSVRGEGREILQSKFSEEGQGAAPLLRLLAEAVEKPGVRLGSPGYLAFIPISSLYPAALGDYLAAVINPYAGNFFASPGAVRLEHAL